MTAIPSVRDLLTAEGLADPYAIYDRWREAEQDGADIGRVVVRYDEVVDLVADRRLSSDRVSSILGGIDEELRARCPLVGRTLSDIITFRDPPDHTRLRTLLSKTFTPRMVRQQHEVIAALTDRLLEPLVEGDGADIHAELTFPLPAMIVGSMLGVPEEDLDRFKQWAVDIVFIVGSGSPQPEIVEQSQDRFGEMREFLGDLVAERREAPRDDLLSAMIAASDNEDRLTEDEIFANATFLMTAGHETATNMMSNGILTLLRHPDQLARLAADRSLMPSAVEEILRFEPPVQMTPRIATESGVLAGREIEAGQALLLFLGAASRDPDRFPEPNRFDIERTANRHAAFGLGAHYCLGAALAREELAIVLDRILTRLPDLALATDDITWQPTVDFRGPTALPITWNSADRGGSSNA